MTEETAVFTNDQNFIPQSEYEVGNYNPIYQLFPVANAGVTIAESNMNTWENIDNYHEHLPYENQNLEAHAPAEIIINEIKRRFSNPKNILELGCGSGRNLYHLARAFPNSNVIGIEVNQSAIDASRLPENATIIKKNVLNIDWNNIGKFDVIFTVGFLMHINHHDVKQLLLDIRKNSALSMHFELHGVENSWDFHRYPRKYDQTLNQLNIPYERYLVFPEHPILSHGLTKSFCHSLIISSDSD